MSLGNRGLDNSKIFLIMKKGNKGLTPPTIINQLGLSKPEKSAETKLAEEWYLPIW
jgi:hypothetical protein